MKFLKISTLVIYSCVLVTSYLVQRFFGGVNEILVELMSQSYYYHYGLFFGNERLVVNTSYGKLEGFSSYSRNGSKFYEFLGVPYSEVMDGERRFQPPQPVKKWNEVKDATRYGYMCLQYDLFLQAAFGHEDCLTLNIYSPAKLPLSKDIADSELLSVIVFIHGGMYQFGRSSDYRPEFFMDSQQVILVSFNYRLNIFGFLNAGSGSGATGNMGLKDQVLALKFIKEEIRNFGGNPNDITLMGESAGAASAHLHTLSPMSRGLFNKVILMSGSALVPWGFIRQPYEQSLRFGQKFGCPLNNTVELVKCLQDIDAWTLVNDFRGTLDLLHDRLDVFAPTAEYDVDINGEMFLNDHPLKLLQKQSHEDKVPILAGLNANEGLVYGLYIIRNQTCLNELSKSKWLSHAPKVLDFEHYHPQQQIEMLMSLWNYYFGENTTQITTQHLSNLVELFSDTSFFKPLDDILKYQSPTVGKTNYTKLNGIVSQNYIEANDTNANIYLYFYANKGVFGLGQHFMRLSLKVPILVDGLIATGIKLFKEYVLRMENRETHYGTCHGDELGILFKLHPLLHTISTYSPEYSFSQQMINTWTHFSLHGKPPSTIGDTIQGSKEWLPYNSTSQEYMRLSTNDFKPISPPFKQRLKFLNSVFCQQRQQQCS